ncbi:ferredoxin reductase [Chamaesiphon minutus]|uniref:Ferredoxin--NADP reductase n=1 Tax=Chamaesiphon minutus (strain ATCC 27169 / PCC 6605) TaxID=1173020 RepID=K9UB57_CHAP6|nr:ferredoxin reductase [Chamaesiphon minutus]AFY92317.1 flavodoxin reductase family protein [Chamaesiphon minutus PCC 6605]
MAKFQWQIAHVTEIVQETPSVKTFTLQLPQWQPHLPGQHYDIRLTAEDGYQAQRSYSIASPPAQSGEIALTVESIADGEVSSYLHEGVAVGDSLEVRGPIGGYFVWGQELVKLPLLLVAGGSGVVPLMSMLRHRAAIGATNPTTLLFSVRTAADVIYRQELEQLAYQPIAPLDLQLTFTRQPPPDWTGYQRRIDKAMLTDVLSRFAIQPQCFVCGPTQLVEQVANTLVDLGLPSNIIRTERFGPS